MTFLVEDVDFGLFTFAFVQSLTSISYHLLHSLKNKARCSSNDGEKLTKPESFLYELLIMIIFISRIDVLLFELAYNTTVHEIVLVGWATDS